MLGRGESARHLVFRRQRPGSMPRCPPLGGRGISRDHVELAAREDGIHFARVGRAALEHNGRLADSGVLRVGDTLALQNQLLLLCTRRPAALPPPRYFDLDASAPEFGAPDALGIVGESPAAWTLRQQIGFTAAATAHVLVLGPSGAGKELVAQAIHHLSARGGRPLVSRSAATLPESIVDAELFGNLKNYPTPGMPERAGLIGEADGATLFLDEIAELPLALQAHLLRLLDAGGEYHRLGEARARRADLRLIGATNRPPEELKHDLVARLTLRIAVPGLDERPEDVPLIVRELLRRARAANAAVVARFFDAASGDHARLHPALVDTLVRHSYTHHVRELEALLWRAIQQSRGTYLEPPQTSSAAPAPAPQALDAAATSPPPAEREAPDRATVAAALERAGGRVAAAARELGLPSRYALYRLMRRFGLGGDRDA
ncbi:MAG: sigma-54-dependent Fis family transcriptional regulator [Myxococcales bacterium]|nr:sigma-54-dependent Fis family transcriptional regulator [Myxococcales bacterium]